jgi:hypothetical protein
MPRRRKPKPTPAFLRETIYSTHHWTRLVQVLREPDHGDYDAVVDVISPLIEKGSRNEAVIEAIRRFNRRFQGKPESWRLTPDSGGLDWYVKGQWDPDGEDIQVVPSSGIIPSTYEALQAFLLSKPSHRRLKRCPECGRYFFDTSRRANTIYNTPTCAVRARARRFRAAHGATPITT